MNDLLTALARSDSPTLSNAIETSEVQSRDNGFADSYVASIFPEFGRMVGYVATASIAGRGEPPPDWTRDVDSTLYCPQLPAAANRVIAEEQRFLCWVRSDEFDPDGLREIRAKH
jgi:hypothetical protein